MPEYMAGFQVAPSQRNQDQLQHEEPDVTPELAEQTEQQARTTVPSSIGEFIVDDLKLFVSPVTAVVKEFRRQLRR